jgi:hypothetical protein
MCSKIAILNCFWIFMTWNMCTSLSIELIIKIKNPLSMAYHKRLKIYYIVCVLFSLLEMGIIGIIGNYGVSNLNTCAISTNSNGEYIYLIIILGNIPIIWIMMLMMVTNNAAKKNKALRLISAASFSMTLTWGLPTFSPIVAKIFGSYNLGFDYFAMIAGCMSGSVIFLIRFGSPQLIAKVAKMFWKKRDENKNTMNFGQSSLATANEELLNNISLNVFYEHFTEDIIKSMLTGLSLLFVINPCIDMEYSCLYRKQKHLFRKNDFEKMNSFNNSSMFPNEELGIWEYEPEIFKKIRELCDKSGETLIKSVCDSKNLQKLNTSIKGGRSNAFIFITQDEELVLKTINQEEKLLLLEILPKYYKRIFKHPDSKIVRILGLYKLRTSKQMFIIMENVIKQKNNAIIFDLKGSSDDRYVEVEATPNGKVLKDKNLEEMNKYIAIEKSEKEKTLNALYGDAKFFKKLNIIDYSLIAAFFDSKQEMKSRYYLEGFENRSYSIGIIDFLQEFTLGKRLELLWKRIKGKMDTSVCSPRKYASRFTNFMNKVFF